MMMNSSSINVGSHGARRLREGLQAIPVLGGARKKAVLEL